jgi:hypothetical protein
MNDAARSYRWPSLMVDEWTATRDTLHMWTQIVGKIRMVHMPLIDHWWQVTLYVSPRGLTAGAVPYRDAAFDVEFDFVSHVLAIRHRDGGQKAVPLAPNRSPSFTLRRFRRSTASASNRISAASPTRLNPLSRSLRTTSTLNTIPVRRTRSGSNWYRPTG